MPALEDIETMRASERMSRPVGEADVDVSQPAREITQTDHLNKRLLSSLLVFMNAAEPQSSTAGQDDPNDDDFED